MPGRTVTLVVCDRSGQLIGQTQPFDVETPWWQDVVPIVERFPTVTVLRLLTVARDAGSDPGGRVTYLVEPAAPDAGAGLGLGRGLEFELEPVHHLDESLLEDNPLRMPWARPGGPAGDLAWATAELAHRGLTVVGRPEQQRTWNLSAIWRIPVRDSPTASGRWVWLKCVPRFFGHEAAVLEMLCDGPVPHLLAADSHRMLLEELPGRDGYEATLTEAKAIVDVLVDLQLRSIQMVPELLRRGIPDCRSVPLAADVRAVVERNLHSCPPAAVQAARDADVTLAEVDRLGLPDVLVHGDAHPGNARIGVDPPVVYDWGDSRIGNPLLDLAVTSRAPDEIREPLVEHWLGRWREAVPGSEPERAWELLRPIARLREAVVYQAFLDNIETTERIYHERDVPAALQMAAEGD